MEEIQGAYYMGDLDNNGSLNYREFENLFDIGRGPPKGDDYRAIFEWYWQHFTNDPKSGMTMD